jgi:hypothetical protein
MVTAEAAVVEVDAEAAPKQSADQKAMAFAQCRQRLTAKKTACDYIRRSQASRSLQITYRETRAG